MSAGTRYGVELRGALPADGADIAALLRELGETVSAHDLAGRLDTVRRDPGSAVLVAADYGPVVGLVAVHWSATLRHARPVARIVTLVVAPAERRRGIGRLLVKAASQAARVAGCDLINVATESDEAASHPFWQAIGFGQSAVEFSRALRKRAAP